MTAVGIKRVEFVLDRDAHLGTGKGAGFSATSHNYVPAATWRGALGAAWWLSRGDGKGSPEGPRQHQFDSLMYAVSFGDAVPLPDSQDSLPHAVALDRKICKYRTALCPTSHVQNVEKCVACGGPTEAAKGVRQSPQGASVLPTTRAALDASEQAAEDQLFERSSLNAPGMPIVGLVAGDSGELISEGLQFRVGGQKSVSGKATVTSIREFTPAMLRLTGQQRLRIELLSPGCYVDNYGRPASVPSVEDVRLAFGLSLDASVTVERSFTRWSVGGGWQARANRPKPEDPTVIAHSVHIVHVDVGDELVIRSVVHDLGVRTSEGCGWASISARPEGENVDAN